MSRRTARLGALALAVTAAAAACNEDFVTGPSNSAVTLDLRGWADTLVLGDARTMRVRVLDGQGREIVGAPTQVDIGAPAILAARLNAAGTARAQMAVKATSDSVALSAAGPGATAVTVTLLDPRFTTVELRRTATVVVAGVRLTSAHDTALTALGDTSLLVASALARQGTGVAADYLPVPGQGVTWTRQGTGAVRLVGSGDSVRVVADAPGVDTLIAAHARCLAGAHCADTSIVRVAQGARVGLGSRDYWMWSLGDSVVPQVVLADARGYAVADARVALVPLAAGDSAVVAVNTTAGVPSFSRSAAPGAAVMPAGAPSAAPAAPAARPVLHLVARASARPNAAAVPATPTATAPLVAKANGTARVAVRALGAGNALLASDTITVVVRQIARQVRVGPSYADVTPGDSVPVMVAAVDARGHVIQDAAFQPTMQGATYRNGRIVVPTTAAPGQATLALAVTGVAQPATYAASGVADPSPDSSRVLVRASSPVQAGDTTAAATSDLTVTLRTADGRPIPNVWVRFGVPAGSIAGPDSALTDANGVARAWWNPPTRVGTYTATAVALGLAPAGGARPDTAGQIVLRRTATVVPAAPTALDLSVPPPATAANGSPVSPAPIVQLADRYGNVVRQAGVTVTASAPAGAAQGFTLGGTLTAVTDSDGRATFPDLVGSGAAGSFPLQFLASGGPAPIAYAPVVTAPIQFTAAPAPAPSTPHAPTSTFAVSATSIAAGQTATVTVVVNDAAGNRVATAAPSDVAVAADLGSIGPVSCASGTCTATYTASAAGTATITAAIGGTAIPGSPATVTVTGALTTTPAGPSRTLTANGPAVSFTPVAASGGTTPYTFALGGAALPAGLTFDPATGAVGGSATSAHPSTTFTVTVTDAAGATSAQTFTLAVSAPLAATSAAPSTALTVGTSYPAFAPVTTNGGTAPVTYAVAGGALPAGVSFDGATGAVSGTPTSSHTLTTYTVTATDANGATSQAQFDLRVDGPPGAPTLGAVTPGDRSLAVNFTAPSATGGAAITNYEYSTNGGASWTAASPATTSSPLTITGLANGTAYQVALRAVNAVGAGGASATAAGTPRTVPGAPFITGVTANPAEISVAFTAPGSDGGAAVANYEYSTDGGSTWTARAPASAASPLVIAGLANGTTYAVALRAVNAAGAGAASNTMNATPRERASAPTALTAAAGNGSVALSWTAPASDGGNPISDYVVEYSSNGGGSWTQASHGSAATAKTVSPLANGTAYTFRVAAVTVAGAGAPSSTVEATPGTPPPPSGYAITYQQQSATNVTGTLTWTAPPAGSVPAVTDYVVQYRTAPNGAWNTVSRATSTATSQQIANLLPATDYEYRVASRNSVGTGSPSNPPYSARTVGESARLACLTPGASNANSNDASILRCPGVRPGQLIVIPVSVANSTNAPITIAPKAGTPAFTIAGTTLDGANQTTLFVRTSDASDSARTTPYEFGWSGTAKNAITLVTYRDVDAAAISFASVTGTGLTASAPATAVADSRYTLAYFFTMASPLSSTTPSVGEWTETGGIWKNTTAGANNANAMALLTTDIDKTASGTTGGPTARVTALTQPKAWSAAVLVLRPAR